MSIRRKSALALLGVAAIAATLAIGVGTASAGDVLVHSGGCAINGGKTVPAGSTISMFGGLWDVNLGVLTNLLNDQTTVVSVNGDPPVNINSLFSAPTQNQPFGGAPPGAWLSYWIYPTGVTLANPGDTLTFTVTITLDHLFAEEFNGPFGFSLGYSPGTVFLTPSSTGIGTYTCTVTAGA